jgi:hypothetical protein
MLFFKKSNKEKTIEFFPLEEKFDVMNCSPVASVKSIPNWYKKIPTYMNENIKEVMNPKGGTNLTVKPCIPFLDALTLGYTITLSSDVLISHNQPNRFNWEVSWRVIEEHTNSQIYPMPIPNEYEEHPFKFEGVYSIQTPPGYSLLFTHPLNRYDLPFITFSGVVDTDTYGTTPVNLPFLIKKDFSGILEKGTPIAQVIPIKRENWNSVTHTYDKNNLKIEHRKDIIKSKLFRSYKDVFWQKKSYK